MSVRFGQDGDSDRGGAGHGGRHQWAMYVDVVNHDPGCRRYRGCGVENKAHPVRLEESGFPNDFTQLLHHGIKPFEVPTCRRSMVSLAARISRFASSSVYAIGFSTRLYVTSACLRNCSPISRVRVVGVAMLTASALPTGPAGYFGNPGPPEDGRPILPPFREPSTTPTGVMHPGRDALPWRGVSLALRLPPLRPSDLVHHYAP